MIKERDIITEHLQDYADIIQENEDIEALENELDLIIKQNKYEHSTTA